MNCSISEVKGDLMFANTNVVVLPVSPDGAGNILMTRRFMNKLPVMRQKYENFCKGNLFSPGKIWIYRTYTRNILLLSVENQEQESDEKTFCFVLKKIKSIYKEREISSISFSLSSFSTIPSERVKELIIKEFTDTDLIIEFYVESELSSTKIISALESLCAPIPEETKIRIKEKICFEI